jgi:hypothetical protein
VSSSTLAVSKAKLIEIHLARKCKMHGSGANCFKCMVLSGEKTLQILSRNPLDKRLSQLLAPVSDVLPDVLEPRRQSVS